MRIVLSVMIVALLFSGCGRVKDMGQLKDKIKQTQVELTTAGQVLENANKRTKDASVEIQDKSDSPEVTMLAKGIEDNCEESQPHIEKVIEVAEVMSGMEEDADRINEEHIKDMESANGKMHSYLMRSAMVCSGLILVGLGIFWFGGKQLGLVVSVLSLVGVGIFTALAKYLSTIVTIFAWGLLLALLVAIGFGVYMFVTKKITLKTFAQSFDIVKNAVSEETYSLIKPSIQEIQKNSGIQKDVDKIRNKLKI